MLEVSGNATVKITDKIAMERAMGGMSMDDRLVVTSEDQSKTVVYSIDFLGEESPDRPASAALSDLTVDGTTVPGFGAEVYTYAVGLDANGGTPAIPVVAAVASDENATVEIYGAEDLKGTEPREQQLFTW